MSLDRLPVFLAVLVAPGETTRSVLARGSRRFVLPLMLLTFISMSLSDRSYEPFKVTPSTTVSANVGLLVAAAVAGVLLASAAAFFLFAWIAKTIGKLIFGGEGSARDLRTAIALGCTPVALALLYRVPAALWGWQNHINISPSRLASLDLSRLGDHLLLGVVLLALDLIVLVSYVVVSTFSIAAAHKITPGEAFGTLVLTFVSPFVVVIAAILAVN